MAVFGSLKKFVVLPPIALKSFEPMILDFTISLNNGFEATV